MLKRRKSVWLISFVAGIILIVGVGFLPLLLIRSSFTTAQQNIIG